MPRTLGRSTLQPRFAAALLACAIAAWVVSGCGSSGEKFDSGEADRALAALDAAQEYVDEGRCEAASRRVSALAKQSTNVNADRPELGEAWAGSVSRLQELVARECVEITETTPTDETTAPTGPTEGPTEEPPPVDPTDGGGTTPDNDNDGGGTTPDNDNDGGNPTPPDNTTPEESGGASPQG